MRKKKTHKQNFPWRVTLSKAMCWEGGRRCSYGGEEGEDSSSQRYSISQSVMDCSATHTHTDGRPVFPVSSHHPPLHPPPPPPPPLHTSHPLSVTIHHIRPPHSGQKISHTPTHTHLPHPLPPPQRDARSHTNALDSPSPPDTPNMLTASSHSLPTHTHTHTL